MLRQLVESLLCLTLVLPAALAPAQDIKEAPLIPRERFFGNPEKARARISPDGKRLAFLAPVDGVLNVWVGDVADLD